MNKDDFFSAITAKQEEVDIEGQPFFIREISAAAKSKVDQVALGEKTGNIGAIVALHCVVDEDGTRIFDECDIQKIEELPAKILETITEKVYDLSGYNSKKN